MGKELIIIVIIIGVVLGILLIVLSGLFHVKKGMVSVFEKLYKFHASKTSGFYFFTPFLIKRVGNYSIEEKYIRFDLKKESLFIVYKLDDAYKYHYKGHDFDKVLNDLVFKLEKENNENFKAEIDKLCIEYGIILIDFRSKEKGSV